MTRKIDELSKELDKINAGQCPQTANAEFNDLLEVAALLRNSYLPVRPPEHILSATVQCAAAGLAKKNTARRNAWLYSGVLGAAAALLIFVGIHGFPSMQETLTVVSPVPQAAPVSSHAEAQTEGNTRSPASETKPSSPEPTGIAPEPAPPSPIQPASRMDSKPQAPATLPATREPLPATRDALPATRQSPALASAPAQIMKEASPPTSAGKTLKPAIIALRPPDRYPDSIVKDISADTLRQVFYSGTPRELIITQRLKPQAESEPAEQSKQSMLRETDNKSVKALNRLNRVVVVIHEQEVTLEGQQTIQELAEVAKTLVPEKM